MGDRYVGECRKVTILIDPRLERKIKRFQRDEDHQEMFDVENMSDVFEYLLNQYYKR